MSPTPKLSDVARAAEVDPATASRALNRSRGWERLSVACVERVERVAAELNYRPNAAARRMRRKQADAVGLLHAPSPSSAYSRELFGGLERALYARGLHTVLMAGADPVASAINAASEGRIDGLISPVFSLSGSDRKRLAASGLPHVLTHVRPDSDGGPAVALDAAAGITAAVCHLADLGHRSLLWLGPDSRSVPDATARQHAFLNACEAHGVGASQLHSGGAGLRLPAIIETARRTLLPVLSGTERPDGIVCYHDPIALGALAAARRAGLAVPRDLSIIGFDDSFGEVADPPLTSLSHCPEEIATAAVDMLLDILKQGTEIEFTEAPVIITPRLVVRDSTATRSC